MKIEMPQRDMKEDEDSMSDPDDHLNEDFDLHDANDHGITGVNLGDSDEQNDEVSVQEDQDQPSTTQDEETIETNEELHSDAEDDNNVSMEDKHKIEGVPSFNVDAEPLEEEIIFKDEDEDTKEDSFHDSNEEQIGNQQVGSPEKQDEVFKTRHGKKSPETIEAAHNTLVASKAKNVQQEPSNVAFVLTNKKNQKNIPDWKKKVQYYKCKKHEHCANECDPDGKNNTDVNLLKDMHKINDHMTIRTNEGTSKMNVKEKLTNDHVRLVITKNACERMTDGRP